MSKSPTGRADITSARSFQTTASLNQALTHLLQRLSGVLEEERNCLRAATFEVLERITMRKDQLAVELARLIGGHSRQLIDSKVRALLEKAILDLDANAALLKQHIEAVGEITGLIAEIVSDASSDGTYTSNVVSQRTKA